MEYPVVLVAQDTTEIDLTSHPATKGTGYLESSNGRGLLLHTLLTISPTGVPLGVLRQFPWTRPMEQLGKRHRRRQTPLTEKESQRWLSLEVHAPCHGPKRPSVRLAFILVEEINPPQGEKPVRWLLATTLMVDSLKDALQYVQWYAYRWIIERFHFVLKSGCKIEQRQLETVERMDRAIPVFSIVAWRLLWLTLQARETPDAPCTMILDESEWKVLWATVHPRTRHLPAVPPTLREATRSIAQLGGFLGRKCDGEPGPQTLWRGLRRLHDLGQGWLTAQRQEQFPL